MNNTANHMKLLNASEILWQNVANIKCHLIKNLWWQVLSCQNYFYNSTTLIDFLSFVSVWIKQINNCKNILCYHKYKTQKILQNQNIFLSGYFFLLRINRFYGFEIDVNERFDLEKLSQCILIYYFIRLKEF